MIEDEVRAQVEALDAAYAANQADAYFAYFADDVTILVAGAGRWTKDDYVTKWGATLARGGGVERAVIDDLVIRPSPLGDAAVATYALDVTYRGLRPDVPVDHVQEMWLLMTEVWFKTDGRWLIAHLDWSTVGG